MTELDLLAADDPRVETICEGAARAGHAVYDFLAGDSQ